MKKHLHYISLIPSSLLAITVLIVALSHPKTVWAVNCTVPISGSMTVSSSCSFPNAIDGIDAGTGTNPNTAVLTINSGATLTVSVNQTIGVGSLVPGNGSIVLLSGAQIKLGVPIWMTDADADGYPANTTQIIQSTTPASGVRRNALTSITQADGSDAVACATNGASAGTCKTCLNGNATNVAAGSDTNSDCGLIDCHTGGTKYYDGWASNVCYYKADVSAANATCDGAGACKTAAVQCAASTQGVSSGVTRTSCKTQVGCTGTTIGSLGNVAAGSDTSSDCGAIDCHTGATKYYDGWASNVCYYKADISAANAVCDGAGACKTAAVQCAASTQGVASAVTRTACKTQVGCTGTTIGSLGNVANGADTSNDCTASLNACSTNTPIGPDGNCDGAGACKTTGNSAAACATAGACQSGGGCSAGSCVSVAADNNSNPTYPAGTYYDGSAVCTGGACQQGQRYYTVNTCTVGSGLAWTNLAANTGCSPTYPAGTYYDGAPIHYSTCQSGYRYYTANTCTVGAGLGWTSIANVAAGQDTYGDCNLGAATIITNFGTGQSCSTLCNLYNNTSDTCNGAGSCTKARSCVSIGSSYLNANDGLIIANAGCGAYAGYNCGSIMANQSPNVCYGATTWWTYCLCQ